MVKWLYHGHHGKSPKRNLFSFCVKTFCTFVYIVTCGHIYVIRSNHRYLTYRRKKGIFFFLSLSPVTNVHFDAGKRVLIADFTQNNIFHQKSWFKTKCLCLFYFCNDERFNVSMYVNTILPAHETFCTHFRVGWWC